ncbi:hypothetical protein FKG94_16725 [Exilibacterium tricleocarpae]|uniref:DUF1795 domain-containing protein n=1 Tax=Exilibacterium tricleocarpae TaxID=2591008 RepID=A0A545TAM1_9GAMM|nr:hypothetical protein [Exilibacterium tricleocarpae]TQV74247.1 hypothetical protein FKG94_16725 [Exilibacterium tricleocarpae]
MKLIYSLILTIMQILSISSAYSGAWSSKHHDISINYNENVWKIIEEHDAEEDVLVGFFDKSDGSSFLVRIEFEQDVHLAEDSLIEQVLSEGLYNSDPALQVLGRSEMLISNGSFYAVDYLFSNKKFGKQIVRHAFLKKKDHIIMLLFAWPSEMDMVQGKKFPAKHMVFIEGIQL